MVSLKAKAMVKNVYLVPKSEGTRMVGIWRKIYDSRSAEWLRVTRLHAGEAMRAQRTGGRTGVHRRCDANTQQM